MTSGAVAGVLALVLGVEAQAACESPPAPPGLATAAVTRVIDGSTVQARFGRRTETIRYLGVVTPGLAPRRSDARRALAVNRDLVGGRAVRLEFEEPRRDAQGRLLAYVYVGDVMVNAELVCRGYAAARTDRPAGRYQALFQRLERQAREDGQGVWPRVMVREGLVSVAFEATHAPEALQAIERATGIPIEVPASFREQTLTLALEARPLEDLLRRVLAALNAGGMALVYGPRGELTRAILVEAAPASRPAAPVRPPRWPVPRPVVGPRR